MKKERFRTRLPAALLLSGLLAATITLLEPTKSAVSNWNEIGIGFAALLARLAVPFVIAFFSIAIFAVLMMVISPLRAIPVFVALYVALWAQGNVFVWEYGSFDASPIDWKEHSGKGVLEIAFWVAILASALTKHEWVRRRALAITAVVFALQLAALAGQVRENAPFPEASVDLAPGATDFSSIESVSLFSRDLNVIIIVLDALQSDFFSEIMQDPELRAAMPPGFTYYRNAISLYEMTEFSLQSMLTSKAVPDNVDVGKWRDEQVSNTVPARLSERGFDAVLTTFSPQNYNEFKTWGYRRMLGATLAEPGSESEVWREDVSNLFALGLFRLSPHFLKPHIYDNGSWQLSRLYPSRDAIAYDSRIQHETRIDLAVFDRLIAAASAGDTDPRFRFLHFSGSHRPYTVDQDCGYSKADPDRVRRERAIGMTHCIVSRLFEFLHKLEEIGVYDQSLIFVVADHGQRYVVLDKSVARPKLPKKGAHRDTDLRPDEKRIPRFWQGVPLVLAKPLGDREALRVSDYPVSLCDVPKSVFDALSIENDFQCESIFSERTPRRSPRIHYRYPTAPEKRTLGLEKKDGIPFEKYSVVGHSWQWNSWAPLRTETE